MRRIKYWGMGYCTLGRRRVARKPHQCDRLCGGAIPVGDAYVEATELPGGQSGTASAVGHPVRLRICAECAYRRGDSHIVDPLTDRQFSRDPGGWDMAFAAGQSSAVAR